MQIVHIPSCLRKIKDHTVEFLHIEIWSFSAAFLHTKQFRILHSL